MYKRNETMDIMKKADAPLSNKELHKSCLIIAVEELSELRKAITKMLRYDEPTEEMIDNLHEEYADVTICLSWVNDICNLDADKIDEWYRYKANRIAGHVKEGVFR